MIRKQKLADILFYRMPGHAIVSEHGCFEEVKDWDKVEGFVVSTFNKERTYVFQPGGNEGEIYFDSDVIPILDEEEYCLNAQEFLNQFVARGITKAVYSRVKSVLFSKDPKFLFFQLAEMYPDAFVYFISSKKFGTWIGATPEILISSVGNEAETMALAGTLPVDDEGTWSKKELEEQDMVRCFIRKKLELEGVEEVCEMGRSEYIAGPVKHLVSKFTFKVSTDRIAALALELHPTPAVSGLPQKKAIKLIEESEVHSRELYAGIIGKVGADATSLFVNLRCARIQQGELFMYLGGGFTSDSIVGNEWKETEEKAKTLLNVIEEI